MLTEKEIPWMTFEQSLSYLLSLGHETLAIKLELTNTQKLLAALGNPHKHLFSVQIAGTNGKGSTAVMLDSICGAAGIRTGRFTSPHLISITERISISGQEISRDEFARQTSRVKAAAERLVKQGDLKALPTFFEQVTAVALLTFCEAKVELAILETGLGGRLDSTTVAGAEIVAITPIAMDHEEHLGDTLAKIAAEKAAIIRPGVDAVIAPQDAEALNVILEQCRGCQVEPRLIAGNNAIFNSPAADHIDDRNSRLLPCATEDGRICIALRTTDEELESVRVGLRGWHQLTNVAVAISLAESLRERGFEISADAVKRGIASAKHPGRLEFREGTPRILFDGAHNPAAARALRDYLDQFVAQPITLIFGAMRDKALREMAASLFSKGRAVVLTEFDNPRAASIEALRAASPADFDPARFQHAASIKDALWIANKVTPADGLICITGSLYLVGAAQEILRQQSASVSG
jgi:dihydrofolate synthase/folylpolyglutamate synthase